MGTNYYCETGRMLDVECDCGFIHQMPETLHIGKDSWGWKFTLHSIPEKGLTCFQDWSDLLAGCTRIFDEYGDDVSLEEMKRTILKKGQRDIDENGKAKMRETAKKYGYILDEKYWLFGGEPGRRQGTDGNYTLMEGEYS